MFVRFDHSSPFLFKEVHWINIYKDCYGGILVKLFSDWENLIITDAGNY